MLLEPSLILTLCISFGEVFLGLGWTDLTGSLPTEIGLMTNLGKWCIIFYDWQLLVGYDSYYTHLLILRGDAVIADLEANWSGTIPSEIGLLTTSLSKLVAL